MAIKEEQNILNEIPIDNGQVDPVKLEALVFKPENCTKEAIRRISESRRFSISEKSSDHDPMEFKRIIHPKHPDELNRIRHACSHSQQFFSDLNELQRKAAFDAMFERKCTPKEVIIKQGSPGDFLYVIESGEYDVFINDENGEHHVHTYRFYGSFGEMSLLYSCPRTATIICHSPGTIWALDRVTFRHIIVRSQASKRRKYSSFLHRVPIFKSLNEIEISKVADMIEIVQYSDMEYVFRQGEKGDSFYIVQEGLCIATQFCDGVEREVGRIGSGGFFGERAIILNEKRSANIKVWSDVLKCYRINECNFRILFNEFDLLHVFHRFISKYLNATIKSPIVCDQEQPMGISDEEAQLSEEESFNF